MKRFAILTAALVFLLVGSIPVLAQDHPEPTVPMQMYHVALLKKGPDWKSQNTDDGMDNRMTLIKNVKKAAKTGLVVTAGLVNDETDVEFIIIFNLKNKYEALEIMEMAPNFKNGMYVADIYSMFAPKGLVVDID
jgi:hypothetical protein